MPSVDDPVGTTEDKAALCVPLQALCLLYPAFQSDLGIEFPDGEPAPTAMLLSVLERSSKVVFERFVLRQGAFLQPTCERIAA